MSTEQCSTVVRRRDRSLLVDGRVPVVGVLAKDRLRLSCAVKRLPTWPVLYWGDAFRASDTNIVEGVRLLATFT